MEILERLGVSPSEIAGVCARRRIVRLEMFGSAARGELRPESDIDLMLTFAPDARASLYDLVDTKQDLEAVFRRPVDVVEAGSIKNPYRVQSIARDLTLVYAA